MAVELINRIDPVLKLNQKIGYQIEHGPVDTSYQTFNIDSFSQTNWNVTVQVPSNVTIIDRIFYVDYEVEVVVSGPVDGVELLPAIPNVNVVPQAFPLQQCANIEVKLNNLTISNSASDVVNVFANLYDHNIHNELEAPTWPDYYGQQNEILTEGKLYNTRARQSESHRSREVAFTFVSNTTSAYTYRMKISEPLIMPPFTIEAGNHLKGFVGVNKVQIQFTLANVNNRFLSINDDQIAVLTGATVTFLATPAIRLRMFTNNDEANSIPTHIHYAMWDWTVYETPAVVFADDDTVTQTFVSPVIQMSEMPEFWVIYVSRQEADITIHTPHTFARIESLNVRIGQKTVMIGSDTRFLYNIAKKYLPNTNWLSWSTFTGSMLCIGPSDLGLAPGAIAGVMEKTQVQFTVVATNITGWALNAKLVVIPMNHSLLSVNMETCFWTISTSFMDRKTALENAHHLKRQAPGISIQNIAGGGFFGSLLKGVKNVLWNNRNAVASLASTVLPGATGTLLRGAVGLTGQDRGQGSGIYGYGGCGGPPMGDGGIFITGGDVSGSGLPTIFEDVEDDDDDEKKELRAPSRKRRRFELDPVGKYTYQILDAEPVDSSSSKLIDYDLSLLHKTIEQHDKQLNTQFENFINRKRDQLMHVEQN
jgi:hypothetical protein